MNVTVVLDGLCEPFMDTTFSKISKIDVDYLRRNPRVDIKEETKLNADQNASDEYYETTVDGTSNFISEIFFLTLAAHHYGSEATNGMLKSLEKEIKYLVGKLAELEAELPKVRASMVSELSTPRWAITVALVLSNLSRLWLHSLLPLLCLAVPYTSECANELQNQFNIRRLEDNVTRFNTVIEKHMQTKFAIEGILFDKQMQTKSILFMRYVTVWLLRVATQSDYTPEKTIQ
jgi:ubiquitin conjugation factor E4 B